MATYYVTQSGAGNNDGLSLENAKSIAQISVFSLSPGDIISLNGTFTSQLIVTSNGSNGNPITYLFADGAKFSAPTWPGAANLRTSGAIMVDRKDYIIIDGGTNGLIECTDNGTNLGNQVDSVGVCGTACSYFTVKNLSILNLYVRVAGTEQNDYGRGIQNTAKLAKNYTNFNVTNCVIRNAYNGIQTDYGPGASANNIEISNCIISETNWGFVCGDRGGGGGSLGTISFYNNRVYNWSNWDDTLSNSWHHNGFFVYSNNTASTVGAIYIFGNHMGPGYGTYATSSFYINGPGLTGNVLAYNNLCEATGEDYPSSGHFYLWGIPETVFRVYNNTLIGGGVGNSCVGFNFSANTFNSGTVDGGGNYYAANNLIVGGIAFFIQFYQSMTTIDINFNLGYNLKSLTQGYSYSTNASASGKTWEEWQALGFDTNGINGMNPLLTNEYRLSTGSPAIGTGTNLSIYFTTDATGNTRVAPWDMGAYAYLVYAFKRLGKCLKLKALTSF